MFLKKKTFLTYFAALFLLTSVLAFSYKDRFFEIQKNLDIFATLYKEVNRAYVDEVNPNTLMREGIDAMLMSLDPYTNYIPEDEIEDYRTMTTGQYGGIGATVGSRKGKTLIIMPFKGFPANKADLKIGDEIVQIDEVPLAGKVSSEVSRLLKGQVGTPVTLKIRSYGSENVREVTLKRETIRIDNVPFSGMIGEDVAYIKLTDFTSGAAREVKQAIERLKNDGADKVILDLRGNPGGLLSEAVNISNLFIDRDLEVVSTRGKMTEWNKTYRAINPALDTKIPLIVLINGRSASASEIVAGVVQDYDRGILVGQRSFGKGLVQVTRPLTYNSQLKVTTAKYYIPSGRCIQALDYSNRSEDGSVSKVPDSLRRAFKTVNKGRMVYDGGGIKPDLSLEAAKYQAISQSLLRENLIFEYANHFANQNAKIAEARNFTLSDAEYQQFVDWVKQKDFDYTSEVENALKELEEAAQEEKYLEAIQGQLTSLKGQLKQSKEADLLKYKDELKGLLSEEIAARYYLEYGKTEASFGHDPELKAALELFQDMSRYQSLLNK